MTDIIITFLFSPTNIGGGNPGADYCTSRCGFGARGDSVSAERAAQTAASEVNRFSEVDYLAFTFRATQFE